MSPPNFVDYRAQQHAFTDIAAYAGMGAVTLRPENADPASVDADIVGSRVGTGAEFGHDPTVDPDGAIYDEPFGRAP